MTQAKGIQGRLIRTELQESAYGVDPSSVHSIKLPFNSFELDQMRNLITPATITGRRDPVAPSQGYIDVSGSAVVPVDKCAIGYWLEALIGAPVTTATGSAFQHVFQVNSTLRSFAFEKGFTDTGHYEKFNGVKVAGASIEIGGDQELTMSFDLVGKGATPGTSAMSAVVTTLNLSRFNQFHASLLEGGALVGNVRKATINISNNLDTEVYLITSGQTGNRGQLPEGMCTVTGEIETMFENWSYYIMAYSGTERSLEVKFQEGSFYLDLKINELLYQQKSPPISSPAGVWLTLAFQAYYNDASPDITTLQATLVNTWSAYSGHLA